MNRTLLDQSPEVAPLLVRLHNRHQLYELAKDKDPEARSELAGIMVDLLNIELSDREKELLADVVISIMRQAEKDLRQALAQRLAAMSNVPLRMILMLANDEIEIAEPVLRQSPVLHDMDLIYLIKSKTSEYWQAIATRAGLNPLVINALAETHDQATAVTLASNDNIILTDVAISIFVEMSKQSDELAKPLLQRDELPGIIGRVLFEYVGAEIKDIIRERFPIGGEVAAGQIDDLIEEFVSEEATSRPSHHAMEAARQAARRDDLRIHDIMGVLRRGQLGTYTAMLTEFTRLPLTTVQEILTQNSGYGLAVISRAYEITKADFMAMFLLTQRLRQEDERVISQQELAKAGQYYDKITKEQAEEILRESRH